MDTPCRNVYGANERAICLLQSPTERRVIIIVNIVVFNEDNAMYSKYS